MGCEELVGSLRKAGEKQVRLLWEAAEREADAVKAGVRLRVEQLRAESAVRRSVMAAAEVNAAVAEARKRARAQRLLAEKTLSDRLYSIAVGSLKRMRDEGYPDAFEKLARELPSLEWRTVRVNPADAGLARRYFPGAEPVPDESITGGLDAATEDGVVRVINTFEKRLQRAWPEILPVLMKDIYREVSDEAPAAP
jgi:V/A-type H+-transporting ATPase subunit E